MTKFRKTVAVAYFFGEPFILENGYTMDFDFYF
jgi:hypothetical protein